MSRWKSPILRAGIVALILFAVKEFGMDIEESSLNAILGALFIAIFGVGMANNPMDKEKF